MKLRNVIDRPRYTEAQNKYNTGRRRTTWRQTSNEATQIWNGARVWRINQYEMERAWGEKTEM